MDNEILKNVVTKSEFQKEIKKVLTKAEFKKEIKKFATKEDLKKFATKEDLEKYATKTDEEIRKLNDKFDWLAKKVMINTENYNRLAIKIISHAEKIELMETKEDANKKFNQIMNRFDDVMGILSDIRTEMAATNAARSGM